MRYLVGPALIALWVWSKFFAPFPGAPPVGAKMDDAAWHAAADHAQSVRSSTLTTLVICLVLIAIAFAVA